MLYITALSDGLACPWSVCGIFLLSEPEFEFEGGAQGSSSELRIYLDSFAFTSLSLFNFTES